MPNVFISQGSKSWANNLNDLRERWSIRREEPVRFIVPVKLFEQDITSLTREELLKLKLDLIKLNDEAKKTLKRHQDILAEEGVYLERAAYSDLFYSIKAIGAHIEAVNHALSKTRTLTFPQVFMNVCKEKLPLDLFYEIKREADERCKTIGGE